MTLRFRPGSPRLRGDRWAEPSRSNTADVFDLDAQDGPRPRCRVDARWCAATPHRESRAAQDTPSRTGGFWAKRVPASSRTTKTRSSRAPDRVHVVGGCGKPPRQARAPPRAAVQVGNTLPVRYFLETPYIPRGGPAVVPTSLVRPYTLDTMKRHDGRIGDEAGRDQGESATSSATIRVKPIIAHTVAISE